MYVSLKKLYSARGKHVKLILSHEGKEHYPNVQAVKNKAYWIKYLQKEDKDVLSEGIDAS